MANQDSSYRVPLSIEIAMATIRNDKRYEKVISDKKRKQYSHFLISRWIRHSQGFLVESDGQPAQFPRL